MANLSPMCEISFLQTFLCIAFAACFTEFYTIKLDTATVGAPKYRGLLGTMATIAREEGLAALWNGIILGLQRQCIYIWRLKNWTVLKIPRFTDNIFTHLLAGLGAGFFAVSIGYPVDVVCILKPISLNNKFAASIYHYKEVNLCSSLNFNDSDLHTHTKTY
ncbi:putative mitochondrial carrier domain-containing protein [Rosa chinensis]|uniref:Putative mitochondrial carrier domain-containing protein n=1 Tax=Rosa chinensis TaxID=74649 RepID=A0A2P6PPR0_ROSCH|nr:putative mitochondrial carrier domain-containing protein [Rosa chinensis]